MKDEGARIIHQWAYQLKKIEAQFEGNLQRLTSTWLAHHEQRQAWRDVPKKNSLDPRDTRATSQAAAASEFLTQLESSTQAHYAESARSERELAGNL